MRAWASECSPRVSGGKTMKEPIAPGAGESNVDHSAPSPEVAPTTASDEVPVPAQVPTATPQQRFTATNSRWSTVAKVVVFVTGVPLCVARFAPTALQLDATTQVVMATVVFVAVIVHLATAVWMRRRRLGLGFDAGWSGLKESSAALTSLVAIGSLALSTATLLITNEQNARQNEIALKAQVAERYAKSIEQLTSDKMEVRIGAVYSLRNIAGDDNAYRREVVRTLAAFVTRNSTHAPCPIVQRGSLLETDAETALQAIGELPLNTVTDVSHPHEVGSMVDDLFTRHGDVNCWAGIRLAGVAFRGYSFSTLDADSRPPDPGTNFDGATFENADFTGTWLLHTSWRGAELTDVDFTGSELTEADLRTNLTNVTLTSANLSGANMCGVTLSKLLGVKVDHARMYGTNLAGAHLEAADLSTSFLHGAVLDGASWDERTRWPAGFTPPAQPTPRNISTDMTSFTDCQNTEWMPNRADEIPPPQDVGIR